MKITGVDWLKTKYQFLAGDSAKKGIVRAFSETFYEYRNKKKFNKLGVTHPAYWDNLDNTNAISANKDAHENQPSSFYSLNKAFKHLGLSPSEVSLLDIGCGAGRVLSFGMLLKFKEVYGVDLDTPALEKAVANCTKMKEKGYDTFFKVSNQDAGKYEIPGSVNVVYLFNPFGEKTMKEVTSNIIGHAEKIGSAVYIVYSNPTCQDVFNQHKKCTRVFESHYKDRKPDIFIFKINPAIFTQGISLLYNMFC